MTDEQKRQIAEETARVLQKSLKERNIQGLKSFLKDLAHRQTQAANQTLSGVIGSHPISNANRENLKHGYYVLSEEEKKILQGNSGNLAFIWDKLKPYNINNNHTAREAAGLDPMKRDNVLEADRVFVVSNSGMESIYIYLQPEEDGTPLTPIYENSREGLIYLSLFANFLANKTLIKNITVTSTSRTVYKQAELVYYTTLVQGRHMYPYSSQLVKDNKDKPKNDVVQMLINHIENVKKIHGYYKGFNHINSNKTLDVSTNSEKGQAFKTEMYRAIDMFKNSNKILSNKSLKDGEGDEKGCHHLVFY